MLTCTKALLGKSKKEAEDILEARPELRAGIQLRTLRSRDAGDPENGLVSFKLKGCVDNTTAEELLAIQLGKLYSARSEGPLMTVTTYPTCRGDAYKSAMLSAFILAKLPPPLFVPESIASALSVENVASASMRHETHLLLHGDVGAGTTDFVAIARVPSGESTKYKVLKYSSLEHGGNDLDKRLLERIQAPTNLGPMRKIWEPYILDSAPPWVRISFLHALVQSNVPWMTQGQVEAFLLKVSSAVSFIQYLSLHRTLW